MNTFNQKTSAGKTFVRSTSVLALTAALTLLSIQAGSCRTLNPQPLPPVASVHASGLVADLLRFFANLRISSRRIIVVGGVSHFGGGSR